MTEQQPTTDQLPDSPEYLDLDQFARLAGLEDHREIIDRWIANGKLPTRRFGRHLLVDMKRLRRMLSETDG